jgi:hypothetical protein
MLKLFGGGGPDHPLANPKEAKRLLEALPAQELKALEELAGWMESVGTAAGFRPAERAALLAQIDDAAAPRVRKLARDYFAAKRPSRYQENLMWTQLHEYWRQAGQAWARAIDANLQAGKNADPKLLPLLAVRTLRSLATQLKWQHLRYGPIDPAVWGILNSAYKVAEERGLADAKVSLGAGGESTAKLEFLRAAVFSASSPDGLLPLEVELAERLIADLSSGFALAKEGARDLLFWTDLARPMAPQRAIKAMPEVPTLRCFGPGAGVAALQAHVQKIQVSRAVPSGLNLGGTYEPEVVLDVLQHLALHWDLEPPERRHARHPVKSRLTINHGFQGALESLGGTGSLDFDASKSGAENWIVENVSAGGFGAVVPQASKGDWLRVGAILAMQPDGGANWVVGIVRRVSRVSKDEARVGIETVSRAPASAKFRVGNLGEHTGLLLPAAVLGSGEVSVALPTGVYARGTNLEASLGGKEHMYMPIGGVAERGEDYELLRFREMVREA